MARTVYEFFWHDLCDWYVEVGRTPPVYSKDNAQDRRLAQEILGFVLWTGRFALFSAPQWKHHRVSVAEAKTVAHAGESGVRDNDNAKGRADDSRTMPPALTVANVEEEGVGWCSPSSEHVGKKQAGAGRTLVKIVVSCPDKATVAVLKRQSDFVREIFAALEKFECGVNAQKPPVSATSVIGKVEIFMKIEGAE